MATMWMSLACVALMVGLVLPRVRWDRAHHYTCAEVLGPHPTMGSWQTIPPHWSVAAGQIVVRKKGEQFWQDFSVWDEEHRLVCDAQGKDVPR